jgi:hypothetical protein
MYNEMRRIIKMKIIKRKMPDFPNSHATIQHQEKHRPVTRVIDLSEKYLDIRLIDIPREGI